MKFKILGSGGYLRIPRATCRCKICIEARRKGIPYKRLGPSIFLEDECVLFDTPEDINEGLNTYGVEEVKHIFYSHWHPDHTLGFRIIEVLMANRKKKPVNVYIPKKQLKIFDEKLSGLRYFEQLNYCRVIPFSKNIKIGNIRISLVPLKSNVSFAFLIESKEKRVLYCPDHSKYLPKNFEKINLLIINCGTFEQRNDRTTFRKGNLEIINKIRPKKTVLMHIEESFGLGYNSFYQLQKKYKNLKFAFDGMKIML